MYMKIYMFQYRIGESFIFTRAHFLLIKHRPLHELNRYRPSTESKSPQRHIPASKIGYALKHSVLYSVTLAQHIHMNGNVLRV